MVLGLYWSVLSVYISPWDIIGLSEATSLHIARQPATSRKAGSVLAGCLSLKIRLLKIEVEKKDGLRVYAIVPQFCLNVSHMFFLNVGTGDK